MKISELNMEDFILLNGLQASKFYERKIKNF